MTLALLAVVIYLNATLPSGTQVDISAAAPAVSALARNHRVRRGAMEPGATQTPLTRRLDIDVGPVETAGPVFELGRRQADPTPANTEWCVTGTFADGRVTSCGFAWLGGTALAYCDGWWPVNRCPACLLPVAPRTTTPSTAPPSAPPPPPEDPTVATAPTMATADPEPEPEPETVGPLIAAPVAPATSTDAPAPVPPAAVTSGPAAAPVAPSSSTTLVALPLVPSIAFSSVPIAAPPPAVVVAVPSPLDPFVPLVVTVLSSPAAATTVPASFPPVSGAPVLPPAPASSAAAEVAAGQPSTVVGSVGIPPSAATMARHTVVQPSLSPVVSSSPNASGDNTTVPDTNAPAPVALAFPVSRTFLGSYLPLLVARAFTMLVTGLGTQASAFEGVRRLLGNVGASAAALAGGAVLTLAPTAVGGVAAHVGSAIVADAMWLDTAYCAAAAGVDGLASLNPCWPPRLAANPGILVTLATLLGIVAVSLVAVAMLWWKMPKNIAADPTSIAGVAAVMGHPEIEREFVALDGEMDMTELMERLEGRKFMLGEWEMAPGRLRWGLMPAPVEHGARHDVRETGAIGKAQGRFERMSQSVKRTLAGWKTARLCADVAFAALIVSLFIVCCVAVAHVDNPRRVFVAYSPKRFGAMRILFAALGIVISLYWGMLFRGTSH